MINHPIPKQPHPVISYFRVGKLLYYSLFLFILESLFFFVLLTRSLEREAAWWVSAIWLVCFIFAFIHIFLVMADGWSRYQNYKRAKDLFYEHGYRDRIARLYIESKCQRNAALVAAEELGVRMEVEEYYRKRGVKWHHFIPYFMVRDPLFFFRKQFWNRTFLEKSYTPKYDYKQLELQPVA
ncbi:hypothetical protein [Robertkochia flava]|uniref:hypothetical protein n=1 Tax=Robertkochia flava TaxID=3447986 RepID=UPI001CCF8229|nr:hypothetical protein [Robertkochia marina]